MSGAATDVLDRIRWPRPFAGLQGAKLADVPREVSAGVTLAALMIPLNIGYAQVAGLPPVAGLYAAIIPLVVYALFTSSRHLVTSPDASMAALVAAALVAFAAPGTPERMQYALALAVVCALLFFLFWIFRLAFLANFLSRAVMAGFITGLGIEVLTNQVRKILAAPHVADGGSGVVEAAAQFKEAMTIETEGYFLELIALIDSIPHANLYSVAIGVGAFLIVRLLKRHAPKVPGALVALVLLTFIVAWLDLPAKGVGVLGAIPSGPSTLTVPAIPAADYLKLLPGALAIVAILMCEGLLVARSYSQKHGYIAYLPNAALAGIVANAVLSLIEVHELRELWRMRRSEFLIAAVCLVSVLALGPLRAVVIAFLLSAINVIRRASRPETTALVESPDGSHFLPAEAGQASAGSGLVIYRFGAPLYFANATLLLDDVERLLTQ